MQTLIVVSLVAIIIALVIMAKRGMISTRSFNTVVGVCSVGAFVIAVLTYVNDQPQSTGAIIGDPTIRKPITKPDTDTSRVPVNKTPLRSPKSSPAKSFSLFIDVNQSRMGTSVWLNDSLYANAAPCTVTVLEGTYELRLEYDDPNEPSPLAYIRQIVVNHDETIRVESDEFKAK